MPRESDDVGLDPFLPNACTVSAISIGLGHNEARYELVVVREQSTMGRVDARVYVQIAGRSNGRKADLQNLQGREEE